MYPLRDIKKENILNIQENNIRPVNINDFILAKSNVPPSLKQKDVVIYEKFINSE